MAHLRITWRASKLIPCPICRGNHSCSATDNGLHFCWRTHCDQPEWRYVKDTANGFGMFFPEGAEIPVQSRRREQPAAAAATSPAPAATAAKPHLAPAELTDYLRRHQAAAPERRRLAEQLGVSQDSLRRLRLGYVPEGEDSDREPAHWLFPERDATGAIVGLLRRYADGRKLQFPGSRRGLVYDPDLSPREGETLLIVEGPSDVAAAMTVGLSAVGRPNNVGGAEMLADLLKHYSRPDSGVRVVVLGENDHKPADPPRRMVELFPGRDGAMQVCRSLADAWGVCEWAMPPQEVKDLREWVWKREPKPQAEDQVGCRHIGWVIRDQVLDACGALYSASRTSEEIGTTCAINLEEEKGGTGGKNLLLSEENIGTAARQIILDGLTRLPCPRHTVPLLQSADNAHRGLTFRADCRSITRCRDVCGARRRSRWLLHLMAIFDCCDVLAGGFVGLGSPYNAFSKAARVAKANYVALITGDGKQCFVVADQAASGKLDPLTAPGAADLVASALIDLADAHKPIRTSEDWALHEQKSKGNYVRRGAAGRGAFELVVGKIRRRGMRPLVNGLPDDRGERCDWAFPAEWSEEQIDDYYASLSETRRPRAWEQRAEVSEAGGEETKATEVKPGFFPEERKTDHAQ